MQQQEQERIIGLLARTTQDIVSLEELKEKLKSGKKLTIKFGADVTAPFLHLGHAVNLWMMRELQEYGHKVIFLIGDFTTRIGDPTGKSSSRKVIQQEEIENNAEEFIKQVSKILITDDPRVFEVRRNSEWFDSFGMDKMLNLFSMVTHAKLISRDMFRKRIESSSDIHMHELIYPILQGFDSVILESDLTIVGSDQLFNEMMGRFFQEKFGQKPQVIITSKITAGLDGKNKQSKSLNNYIAITDSPREKFGKVMSLPDNLIIDWLKVYTKMDLAEIDKIENKLKRDLVNPRDMKLSLAEEIVNRYHSIEAAVQEKEWFLATFSKKEIPTDIPEVIVETGDLSLMELLKQIMPQKSNSELKRMISQGGVKIDDQKVIDPLERITIDEKGGVVLRTGKKSFFKVLVV